MAVTDADIVNRALQLVGGYDNVGPITGTPPNFDSTPAGEAAGILYNGVVQTVGRQFGWDFSRNVADLVVTANTPPLGFDFEYQYPSSGIQVRQVLPPSVGLDANNPLPYKWVVGNSLGGSVSASGYILLTGLPADGNTITLNGIPFTFRNSAVGNFELQIGPSIASTVFTALFKLPPNLNNVVQLTVAEYSNDTGFTKILINYIAPGPGGNLYTLAKTGANITLSAATLTGGANAQQRVIWTDIEDAQAVFSGQPPAAAWDSLFTEAVVRLLASELALALDGKPETSALALNQSAAFEKIGEMRGDS